MTHEDAGSTCESEKVQKAKVQSALDRPKTHPEIQKFRREGLIKATLRVVAESGIENTTIARICETAGVSRGLANHYFAGKDELLQVAFECLLDDLNSATAKAARAEPHATGKLFAIVDTILSEELFKPTARAAYLCFWTASLTNESFAKTNRASYMRYHASIARLFQHAADERSVEVDARKAAIGLIGMIDGLWLDLSIGVEAFSPFDAVISCRDFICERLRIAEDDPDFRVVDPSRFNAPARRRTAK